MPQEVNRSALCRTAERKSIVNALRNRNETGDAPVMSLGRRIGGRIAVVIAAVLIVVLSLMVAVLAFLGTAVGAPNKVAMYAVAIVVGIVVAYGLSLIVFRWTRRRRAQGAGWGRRTLTSSIVTGVTALVLVATTAVLATPSDTSDAFPEGDRTVGSAPTQHVDLSTGSPIAWWKTEAKTKSGKPPIVFVHGGPGYFVGGAEPLIEKLALAEGRDAYYFDQVGAGYSGLIPADQYSLQRLLDDLDAFRTEVVKSDEIALIGHSFGGFYAEAYAADHPEAVEKVALLAPLGYGSGLSEAEDAKIETAPVPESDQLDTSGVDSLTLTKMTLAGLLQKISPSASEAFMSQEEQMDGFAAIFGDAVGTNRIANSVINRDAEGVIEEVLKGVTETALPTLVVRPEFDYIHWSASRRYRDLNPNATMVFAPDLTHGDINIKDDAVYNPLRAFFADEDLRKSDLPVYDGEEDPHFFYENKK